MMFEEDFACEHVLPNNEPACRGHVQVLLAETPLSPVRDAPTGALDRKRTAIWFNDRRNNHIAGVAEAFVRREMAPVWDARLMQNEDDLPAVARGSVAILAESFEHGQQLADRLPGWMFFHLAPQCRRAAEPLPMDALRRSIVTIVAAHEMDLLDAQVLIVATGGQWAIDLPSYPPLDREVLLVDFGDDFDVQVREDTIGRLRGYMARGWRVDAAPKWDLTPAIPPGATARRRRRPRTPADELVELTEQVEAHRRNILTPKPQ